MQIDRWPTLKAFAEDAGVTYGAAKQMRRRGSIPVEHWPAILGSDRGQQLGLTAETLMDLHTQSAQGAHDQPAQAAE